MILYKCKCIYELSSNRDIIRIEVQWSLHQVEESLFWLQVNRDPFTKIIKIIFWKSFYYHV